MPSLTTPAVLLRRIPYGDADVIVTLFTRWNGKTTAIAKSAKKSRKRFSGVLEPFSEISAVLTQGKNRTMDVLTEAGVITPFEGIRADIRKTAHAGYWSEIVAAWLPDLEPREELYALLRFVLAQLHAGSASPEALGVLFQLRFLISAGLQPDLCDCGVCGRPVDLGRGGVLSVDVKRGAPVCRACGPANGFRISLSPGTVKQLLWFGRQNPETALRARFSALSLRESREFLEAFVPYHLGMTPKSLAVLRRLRNEGGVPFSPASPDRRMHPEL